MESIKKKSDRFKYQIKSLFFVINVAIIIYGALYYDLDQIVGAFRNLVTENGIYALSTMIILQVVLIILQVFRLSKFSGEAFEKSYSIYMAGAAANAIMPLRLGEGYRLVSASINSSLNIKIHIGAIIYERGMDLYYIAALIIISIFIQYCELTTNQTTAALLITCFALTIAIKPIGLILIKTISSFSINAKLQEISTTILSPIVNNPLSSINVANVLVLILNISIPSIGIGIYFNSYEYEIGVGIEIIIATLMLMGLPMTPGAIGVFEIVISTLILKSYSIENQLALSFAMSYHFAILAPQITLYIIDVLNTGWIELIMKRKKNK